MREYKANQLANAVKTTVPPLFRKARYGGLQTHLRDLIEKRGLNQGLFLWGPAGTGKSYALCALARHMIVSRKVDTIERLLYDDFMLQIRQTYQDTSKESERQVIQRYMRPQILIVEDIGVTKSAGAQESDFSLRVLFVLIDWRLEHLRPTFITSNKSLEQLTQSFDSRIGSRLTTFKVIQLSGKDRRKN